MMILKKYKKNVKMKVRKVKNFKRIQIKIKIKDKNNNKNKIKNKTKTKIKNL